VRNHRVGYCITEKGSQILSTNLTSQAYKRESDEGPLTSIMIAGMRIPPNLGADYTGEFEQVFSDLATKNGAVLVPFLLRGRSRQSRSQPAGSNPSDCRRPEDHRRDGVEEVAAIVADEMNCWATRACRHSEAEALTVQPKSAATYGVFADSGIFCAVFGLPDVIRSF